MSKKKLFKLASVFCVEKYIFIIEINSSYRIITIEPYLCIILINQISVIREYTHIDNWTIKVHSNPSNNSLIIFYTKLHILIKNICKKGHAL